MYFDTSSKLKSHLLVDSDRLFGECRCLESTRWRTGDENSAELEPLEFVGSLSAFTGTTPEVGESRALPGNEVTDERLDPEPDMSPSGTWYTIFGP